METERALERLKEAKTLDKGLICRVFQLYPKEIEAIEKVVKAVEIIKDKADWGLLLYALNKALTDEEKRLLTEVLK